MTWNKRTKDVSYVLAGIGLTGGVIAFLDAVKSILSVPLAIAISVIAIILCAAGELVVRTSRPKLGSGPGSPVILSLGRKYWLGAVGASLGPWIGLFLSGPVPTAGSSITEQELTSLTKVIAQQAHTIDRFQEEAGLREVELRTAVEALATWKDQSADQESPLDAIRKEPNAAKLADLLLKHQQTLDRERGVALIVAGKIDDAVTALRRAVNNEPNNMSSHYHLGVALVMAGRFDEATIQFDRTESLAGEARAPKWIAAALRAQSEMHRVDGGFVEAQTLLQAALKVDTEAGNEFGQAKDILGLARIAEFRGERETARSYFVEALALYRRHGENDDIAHAHRQMGFFQLGQHEYAEATASATTSLRLSEEAGDSVGVANARRLLARVLSRTSDLVTAEEEIRKAIALDEKSKFKSGLAAGHGVLASILAARGQKGPAIASYRQALSYAQEGGSKQQVAAISTEFSAFLSTQSCFAEAALHANTANALTKEFGPSTLDGAADCNGGVLAAMSGAKDEARFAFERAIEKGNERGDLALIATTMTNYAVVECEAGNLNKAVAMLFHAGNLHDRLGDTEGLVATLTNLAVTFASLGYHDDAVKSAEMAAALADEHGYCAYYERLLEIQECLAIGCRIERCAIFKN